MLAVQLHVAKLLDPCLPSSLCLSLLALLRAFDLLAFALMSLSANVTQPFLDLSNNHEHAWGELVNKDKLNEKYQSRVEQDLGFPR